MSGAYSFGSLPPGAKRRNDGSPSKLQRSKSSTTASERKSRKHKSWADVYQRLAGTANEDENDPPLLADDGEEEAVAWEASSSSPVVAMKRDVRFDAARTPASRTKTAPGIMGLATETVNEDDPAMELLGRYQAAMPSSSPLPTWPAPNETSTDRSLRRVESCGPRTVSASRATPVRPRRHVTASTKLQQLCSPGVLSRTLAAGPASTTSGRGPSTWRGSKSANVAELLSLAGALSREGSAAPSGEARRSLSSPASSPIRRAPSAFLPSDELDDDIDLGELASLEQVCPLM